MTLLIKKQNMWSFKWFNNNSSCHFSSSGLGS